MCLFTGIGFWQIVNSKIVKQAREKWEETRAKRHDDRMRRFECLIDDLTRQQKHQTEIKVAAPAMHTLSFHKYVPSTYAVALSR